MTLTPAQTLIILLMFAIGVIITRFLPFVIFKGAKSQNSYIRYLGEVLPYSAIGMLVVYCLKDVNLKASPFGIPEGIAVICIALLHYWKENTLLSIGAGTVVYMILVQYVFMT